MTADGGGMDEFWQSLSTIEFRSEAEVEARLLLPLLESVEYRREDIQPKVKVNFFTGRKGHPHEADLVAFAGPEHNRDTALLVIEAKAPSEPVENCKEQAESYATWLRAPVYLQTNGIDLEIWQLQPASESIRVFRSPVSELLEQRGELEFILRKLALIEHCRKLKLKTIFFEDANVLPYVDAIASIAETSLRAISIDRRLINIQDGATVEVASSNILEEFPHGCVVRVGTGVGKTTLARQMLEWSLKALTVGGADKIPIELYLPDVAALRVPLIEFAKDRLAPHVPQYESEYSFKELLRRGRILLICDAFDRVSTQQRPRIAGQLRAFVKDYPHSQLFVLSRPPASFELSSGALPLLDLALMNDQEMLRMAEISAGIDESQSHSLLNDLPSALKVQCRIPFFFDIIINDYARLRQVPRDTITPFRGWIDALIHYDSPPPQTAANRLVALKAVAAATAESPLPLDLSVETLRNRGLPERMLGDLEVCGLIQQRTGYIELLHEALGDFLRAEAIASIADDSEFNTALKHVTFASGSAFAIFLAGLLSSPQRQKAFWDVLLRVEFDTYLDALRFRADLSTALLQIIERDEFQR